MSVRCCVDDVIYVRGGGHERMVIRRAVVKTNVGVSICCLDGE